LEVRSQYNSLISIIDMLVTEEMSKDNRALKVRGFKGYGAGHTHVEKKSTNLGISPSDKLSQEERESETQVQSKGKVKISKAFRKLTPSST